MMVCAVSACAGPDGIRMEQSSSAVEQTSIARVRLYSFLTPTVIYPNSQCADRKNPSVGNVSRPILFGGTDLGIKVPGELVPEISYPERTSDFKLNSGEPVTLTLEHQAVPNYNIPSTVLGCREIALTFTPKAGTDYQLWYRPMGSPAQCRLGLRELHYNEDGTTGAVEVTDVRRTHRCDT